MDDVFGGRFFSVFGDRLLAIATQLEGSGGCDLALAVSIQAQIKVERAGLAQLGAKGAHNVGGLLLDATDIADGPGHAARAQQRDRGHGDDKQTNGKANHELNQCQAGLEFQVFLLFIPCWISASSYFFYIVVCVQCHYLLPGQ